MLRAKRRAIRRKLAENYWCNLSAFYCSEANNSDSVF